MIQAKKNCLPSASAKANLLVVSLLALSVAGCRPGEPIAASAAAYAFHQLGATQRHEQLFQIGGGEMLAFGDHSERHGFVVTGELGYICHCHHRIPTSCVQLQRHHLN